MPPPWLDIKYSMSAPDSFFFADQKAPIISVSEIDVLRVRGLIGALNSSLGLVFSTGSSILNNCVSRGFTPSQMGILLVIW